MSQRSKPFEYELTIFIYIFVHIIRLEAIFHIYLFRVFLIKNMYCKKNIFYRCLERWRQQTRNFIKQQKLFKLQKKTVMIIVKTWEKFKC